MSIDSEIAYAARVLKLPVTGATYAGLADQGRQDGWSFEEYLAVVLSRQVAAREANGSQLRIRKAKFPRIHTLEDFNFDYQVSAPRELIAHVGTATFIANASNVILLGPPGTGKTHLATGIGIKAAQAGYSVAFDTATGWITRLRHAHDSDQLAGELSRIGRYKLIIIDELGYIPLDADSANLFSQLVSARYETSSIIITSNLPFARWGEALSDPTVAAASIDRLIHHADIIALKGESYRTRNRKQEQTK
ncbi:MAG: IS21-like element helper ATPase IstB [Ancrocorticia sp.]|jgi:DNA replication protein DnaC|nr:IS21-like element helper ATPase IstB [Ancrocorticia sp.]